MGEARHAHERIAWLLASLFVSVVHAACGTGESLIEGTLLGWSAGTVVEIAAHHGARSRNNHNVWSICVPSTGEQIIRISSDSFEVKENSQGQSPANELTLMNASTDRKGFSFTLQKASNRILATSTLPAAESVEWMASLPGFKLQFAIVNTADRAFDTTLASFGDCSVPLSGSGLSRSGPRFIPNQASLSDTVILDVDQLSSSVYQVDSADSTMATLQFCHILSMYIKDPVTGIVSSTALHRSLTKVSASINLLQPFTTPAAIQLSSGTANESVELDGVLSPTVNVFACDSSKQEITQSSVTAGETIRICVGSTPPPDSISDLNLAATPTTGGNPELYSLVSLGTIQQSVPGRVILGDCNNDVCAFDFSPQFSFFLDTSYSLTLTGTIQLRIGNRLRQRQLRELEVSEASSANFVLTVETVVSSLEQPSAIGLSTTGVTALVILAAIVVSMSAVYIRYYRKQPKASEEKYSIEVDDNEVFETGDNEVVEVDDNDVFEDDDNEVFEVDDNDNNFLLDSKEGGSNPQKLNYAVEFSQNVEDVVEFSDSEV